MASPGVNVSQAAFEYFFPKYVYVKFPFVHLRTNLSISCPNLTYVANLNGYVIKLLPF